MKVRKVGVAFMAFVVTAASWLLPMRVEITPQAIRTKEVRVNRVQALKTSI